MNTNIWSSRNPAASGTGLMMFFLAFALTCPMAPAAPVVSNLTFVQKADNTLGSIVEITYDLESNVGPCTIRAFVSTDGGATYTLQLTGDVATGDIGSNIAPGTGKKIVWAVRSDFPDNRLESARIRLEADDGYVLPGLVVPLVDVPEGRFTLGMDSLWESSPSHSVTLSAYQIGKYEITNGQYATVLNWAYENNRLLTQSGDIWAGAGNLFFGSPPKLLLDLAGANCNIEFVDNSFQAKERPVNPSGTISTEDHPVVMVSWYGAVAFCNWLSELQGLTPCYSTTGASWTLEKTPPQVAGYRLPTEAEWERAAGWNADTETMYHYAFSSDNIGGKQRANYWDGAPNIVNPLNLAQAPLTSPVGWFDGVNTSPNGNVTTVNSPSPVGCYDMTGNVLEWINDWYGFYSASPKTNPLGPSFADFKVIRGGGYTDAAFNSQVSYRSDISEPYPFSVRPFLGFRVVRSR